MDKNLPQIFDYQSKKIRTTMVDGEPWFVAADVCKILGLQTSRAVHGSGRTSTEGLYDDEKGVLEEHTCSRNQKMLIVSEPGLYHLIFKSVKPEAREFQKWVYSELLPTIRKTGAYITDRADPVVLREKADENEKLSDVNILAQMLLPIYAAAGMKPEFQLMAAKQFYKKANIDIPIEGITVEKQLFDTEYIAKAVGIYSASSNGEHPHPQAVYSILQQIDIMPDEKELVPYTRHGHSGTTYQYTIAVIDKVRKWLVENNYPTKIQVATSKRAYGVVYKTDRGLTA